MHPVESREDILCAERAVLQAMCSGAPEGSVWDNGTLILGSYPFRDVIHQLIFDTLREINTDIPEIIRQQLPLRMLRKAFSALDVSVFVASHGLRPDEVVALMRLLRASTGDEWSDSLVR
jgi:hypothetical protein